MPEDLRKSKNEIISREYADNIIRSMTESLIVVSPQGIIETVNPATCALLGYEQKEIVGQPVGKVVAEEEEEEEEEELFKGSGIEDLIKKGSVQNVERAYLSKDGAKIPVLFSGSVMRDEDGKIQGIVCVAQDITELKRAEEQRAAVIDAMPDALIVLDLNGVVLSVNPSMTKMLGYKPEERVGKSFDELRESIKPEDIEKFLKLLGQLIETGHMESVETVLRAKDGREIPTSVSYSLIKDSEGIPTNIIALVRDITELKRLQEREKEALVLAERAATIDAMIDGVLVHDLEGKIMSANKSLEDMAGYKKEEYLGKSLFEFVKPEESQKARADLTELLETGKVGPQGAILPTKDGRGIPVQTIGSLMRDAKGNPAYGVVVIRDITERKQAEEQMRGLIRDTLNAQEAERERICLEVHDGVTQTLASAFQYLQTLESASLDGSNAKQLLLRASALVRQAIQESREVINSLQPATLRDLGLVATLRQEMRQLEQEMRWRVDFKADVIRLPNDVETGLYRIIREAITNVRKHAETKRLGIRITSTNDQVKVEVRDWGIGFNYDPQAIGRRKGTGLISMRKRAELLQGTCDIESTPGQGTTVRVEIPSSSYREQHG